MVIHCLAFVGKQNEPLFVHVDPTTMASDSTATSTTTTMYLESIIHASLDIIEERRQRKQPANAAGSSGGGGSSASEMFMGQLFVVEDYRVFAWCSNTLIKTIIICDIGTSEGGVREVLQHLYRAYILCVQNPFQPAGKQMLLATSKRLKATIQQQIRQHNESSSN